jgi:hypothetical protein
MLTLVNCTVYANASGLGEGGIGGEATLKSTIIAGNTAQNGNCGDVVIISAGYNLDSDGTCNLTGPGDLSNTDPLLGPLQDNDGPTFTHPLLPGSPAINAGDPNCPPPDTD